jgi:hypothetical protein
MAWIAWLMFALVMALRIALDCSERRDERMRREFRAMLDNYK